MSDFNTMFRQPVCLPTDFQATFDNLHKVLELTAQALPFANTAVMLNRSDAISRGNLIASILRRGRGGLCYELNPLLYLFLSENGIISTMYYGRVNNGKDFGS